MLKKIIDALFGVSTPIKESNEASEKLNSDISIEPNRALISQVEFDWNLQFPISGDESSCQQFKEIINSNLFSGQRSNSSNPMLLDLITNGSVKLDQLIEFQIKVIGKYAIEGRKILITDNSFDEIPYGTLSSLIAGDPKTHLNAYLIAVNNYMMLKYHIARYIDSGIKQGTIRATSNAAKRCLEDDGRKIMLNLKRLPIPHYLGCNCSIRPIVKF